MNWICTNDRYCQDPEHFDSVEDFEAMVRECFPDECEDLELREGSDRDGQEVVYDEHNEVALRRVTRPEPAETAPEIREYIDGCYKAAETAEARSDELEDSDPHQAQKLALDAVGDGERANGAEAVVKLLAARVEKVRQYARTSRRYGAEDDCARGAEEALRILGFNPKGNR